MSEREAGDLEPMSDEMRDYVAAFAAVERPDAATSNATWAAIEAEVAPPSRRGIVIGVGAAVAIAAAVVLLVAGVQRAVLERDSGETGVLAPHEGAPDRPEEAVDPEPRNHASRAVPPRSAGAAEIEATTDVPAEAEAGVETSVEPPLSPAGPNPQTETKRSAARPAKGRPTAAAAPSRDEPAASPSTLADELRRFKAAKAAFDAGDPKTALAELQDYAKEFPRGALRRESQVLRARALCAAGNRARARKLRDDFIEAHPLSPLASRMREVCRD